MIPLECIIEPFTTQFVKYKEKVAEARMMILIWFMSIVQKQDDF